MITLANIKRSIYNICKRLDMLEASAGTNPGGGGSSGGGFSGDYNDLKNKPTIPSNENAASGGTTLSVVTTGEKYNWNNKANIWRGTQDEYDLITPDDNTIYIITPAPL